MPGFEEMKVCYKEIFMRKHPDVWNEITLNTGGISSTLQDIKAHQRSGGYVYKKVPNRFIYWRSDRSTLEIVEESLDYNLHGNQIRYKFSDSPVLEGISITETSSSIVILVPTISSLHRFTYPHPNTLVKKGYKEQSSYSIFHHVNETNSADPSTYFILNSPSSSIISGVSCLDINGDSIFALSLANASILIIHIDTSGHGNITTLKNDSIVPRFFLGITGVIRGKEYSDGVSVSLVLSYIQSELYLFGLDREGTLKIWSLSKNSLITSYQLLDKNEARIIKGHKHKMCKGEVENMLILYCCLQGSCVSSFSLQCNDNDISLQPLSQTSTPAGLKLVDMCVGENGDLWCNWLTGDESPTVTKIKLRCPEWATVLLAHPPLQVENTKFIEQDPASLYLDAMFTSGFFTANEVAKALSIFKTTAIIKPHVDIKEQICAIVEAEIYSETGGQDLDDDEYLEMTQRCWSRLYSCCSQFVISGMLPLGMVWLGSSLILIQEYGFSMVMEMCPLQLMCLTQVPSIQFPNVSYADLLEAVRNIDLDLGLERLQLGLISGESITTMIKESLQYLDNSNRHEIGQSMLNKDTDAKLKALLKELYQPQCYSFDGSDRQMFCSNSGLFAVTSTFRDFCSVRLQLCEKLLLLMELCEGDHDHIKVQLAQLCEAYYVLYWTCITNVTIDEPIILSYVLEHQSTLMQDSIAASVLAVASAIWIRDGNVNLANHLYSTKQWMLLQALARITNYDNWRLQLAESYLHTGESGKAYDVAVGGEYQDMSHHTKVISLFERHSRPDLVISVAEKAMAFTSLSRTDRETLQSVLFLHQIQLKDYVKAYVWVEECKNWTKKSDFLHRLVTAMLADNKLNQLIEFTFTGLTAQLDKFLSSRARLKAFKQAANYYNLLYSLHIKRNNFKRAATFMFEKALRSDTTEMQWRSYATCLNALTLVPEEDAWVVRPTFAETPNQDSLEILSISDIRKEYELSGARYNLGECCAVDTTQEEVITLCIQQHQYKTALRLAYLCNLSCAPVIAHITEACLEDYWEWSNLNVIDDIIPNIEDNDIGWRLLEKLLNKYEKETETELHRAAASKILEKRMFLPTWLVGKYLKKNATELLRLYIAHGYLIEASNLACDYIKAALGIGSSAFAIEHPLLATAPPQCLPINLIQVLIDGLEYFKVNTELKTVFLDYQNKVKKISEEMKIVGR